ncbi:protein phosphatase 2C domain-containing protein [Brasilonema sp. UFV-L1]|uniref:protein phosphatase 2C domain-containing protein n=1 Tax=Brasilonema sp. UFV-L1 TaxID=2234130 RepID=UPI00145C43F8|nr:protein phosphatase 2C domain-containing protein [Brasilonema sp. UFV-L1]NMG05720.1 serine/threonine-protein phosphatase [Brasilonema sp. UFV-L1]
MISTQRIISCTNPNCTQPINSVGDSVCATCQTPLVYRYLWATGSSVVKIQPGENVANRYEVITPKIWLDTQPGLLPEIPEELSQEIVSYLKLYQHRLHIPQAYGFAHDDILLLENVPIDETGNLYPAITDAWEQAQPVRQVYWLWQILQLWTPLSELGVAGSLLILDNLRVQGWCVRLLELVNVEPRDAMSLQQLGECWQPWVATAKTPIAQELNNIVEQMRSEEVNLESITAQLNILLLSSAADLPLTLEVAGATDSGVQQTQNEDTCYPTDADNSDDPLLPRVSIICDGIAGHEGGEVASFLAVESLKLQLRALLTEVKEQADILPADLIQKQLEASLRIVNNVICNCNDEQKREGTQRMGTTLVMAVQLPQTIKTPQVIQSQNTHELYLTHVGDSRAYWITQNHCHLLTIDNDVAGREVRYARSLYRKALQRPDATGLTQALGTKDGEFLRPVVQRFILEEDGILLLCSDGLSDNNLVEHSWRDYAIPVLQGTLSLEDAVRQWIELANQKNAHDNISVVLTHCRVSPEPTVSLVPVSEPVEVAVEVPVEVIVAEQETQLEQKSDLAPSSQALLELLISEPHAIDESQTSVKRQGRKKWWFLFGGLLVLLVGGTSLGLFAWWRLNPQTFQQVCGRLPQKVQQVCSPQR